MQERQLTTAEKALRINLDDSIYGSFAEIGAGQEVAANFFKAGGASGTVAKTMSAYDMAFSDAIYGATENRRYVCEPRLIRMLEHEYSLMELRLKEREQRTCFFAFANTCVAINYHKTNQGHGWLGLRFQLTPSSKPNDVIIHANLFDRDTLKQYQTFGVLGTNLIYACYYYNNDTDKFINSLLDGLSKDAVEIDMIRFNGPDFDHLDNRLMSLKLVKNGLSNAALFGPDGSVFQPSEYFYKKNILALRGRFRPVTYVNLEMFSSGLKEFLAEPDVDESKLCAIMELTLSNLRSEGEINDKDFLDRVDILCSMGHPVLISNYQEYHSLTAYFSKFTKQKVGLVLGVYNLLNIFDEKYYENLSGGIMESFGMLFAKNIKMYVYPAFKMGTSDQIYDINNFETSENLKHLFQHLLSNQKIGPIKEYTKDYLKIVSDNVLAMIKNGEKGWEALVPEQVASTIKKKKLFGYTD